MKILNLYAGLGGNRKLWQGHEVHAVELNEDIARVYQEQHSGDKVIVADAHKYLLDNFEQYDMVWSSPPCQTHSKMNKATRHKNPRYPDMQLYQEIIFMQNFFKGYWVVENVKPYYEPLIKPTITMGRHLFWSNFKWDDFDVKRPANFINKANLEGKRELMDWLGIHYEKNIYYEKNHCPAQILRNCVHPLIGKHILDSLDKQRKNLIADNQKD